MPLDNRKKFDKIIPVGKKEFAYQCEGIQLDTRFILSGFIPSKGGSQPYLNEEKDTIGRYELVIEKFTSNSFTVILYKYMKHSNQRIGYETTFDFASFVNAIFKNVEVSEYDF